MTRNKAARRSGNYDTRQVSGRDTDILADWIGGFIAFAVCLGVPTIMALMKCWGWW